MSAAIIQTNGLSVRFGSVQALDCLDLTLEPGTIGLLGPNGAGKSTLIKVLLDLVRPQLGEAHLLGVPVRGKAAREVRARIGYMPEEECLLPGLDAVTYLRLCARLCGLPDHEGMKRAHEALFLVGLGEARYREAEEYSTGMRQRLKLAQALVHGPDLLFLDEPTSGLDPTGRKEMLALIRDVAKREHLSVVLSTHLLGDVEEVCDHVAVIHEGNLVLQGAIEELRRVFPNRYELRFKGPVDAFRREAESRGIQFLEEESSRMTLDLPDGTTPEQLMEMARATGGQVRYLQPVTVTLREAFMESLGQGA